MHRRARRWLSEHSNDPYVKLAQIHGFRSRSAFKLKEIQARDRIFSPGMSVVDLGAAPGGWSQVAAGLVGRSGYVIALDALPMERLKGVTIIQGDFREKSVIEHLDEMLLGNRVHVVMSDMAPNLTGVTAIDQPAAIALAELALASAVRILEPGGVFLVKMFQGSGIEEYRQRLQETFERVVSRKPKASRAASREVYLLARKLRRRAQASCLESSGAHDCDAV